MKLIITIEDVGTGINFSADKVEHAMATEREKIIADGLYKIIKIVFSGIKKIVEEEE